MTDEAQKKPSTFSKLFGKCFGILHHITDAWIRKQPIEPLPSKEPRASEPLPDFPLGPPLPPRNDDNPTITIQSPSPIPPRMSYDTEPASNATPGQIPSLPEKDKKPTPAVPSTTIPSGAPLAAGVGGAVVTSTAAAQGFGGDGSAGAAGGNTGFGADGAGGHGGHSAGHGHSGDGGAAGSASSSSGFGGHGGGGGGFSGFGGASGI